MPTKETFWFLDGLMRVRVASGATAKGVSVLEHTAPYGSAPPLHVHHNEDEIFHLLEGDMRFLVDGAEIHLHQGETLLAPKGKPHGFVVASPAGARWLITTCRGDFERMARSIGRPAAGECLPPVFAPTPAEIAALDAACRAHYIEIVGPPLAVPQFDRTVAA